MCTKNIKNTVKNLNATCALSHQPIQMQWLSTECYKLKRQKSSQVVAPKYNHSITRTQYNNQTLKHTLHNSSSNITQTKTTCRVMVHRPNISQLCRHHHSTSKLRVLSQISRQTHQLSHQAFHETLNELVLKATVRTQAKLSGLK